MFVVGSPNFTWYVFVAGYWLPIVERVVQVMWRWLAQINKHVFFQVRGRSPPRPPPPSFPLRPFFSWRRQLCWHVRMRRWCVATNNSAALPVYALHTAECQFFSPLRPSFYFIFAENTTGHGRTFGRLMRTQPLHF